MKLKSIPVLDKGYIMLVDNMGTDSDIATAARVSYSKGTKKTNSDEALIRYLIRHHHETPLEMIQFKFQIKLPLFVFAQWVRHRIGSFNVTSYRYSEIPEEFYIPEESRVNVQSKDNKQCSSTEISDSSNDFIEYTKNVSKASIESYNKFVYNQEVNPTGVARELARINIPQSLYTEFIWSINLRALLNFINLRIDEHAQYEIREYAKVLYAIIKELNPIACKAFDEYVLNSFTISKTELKLLNSCIDKEKLNLILKESFDNKELSKREIDILKDKFI